MQGVRGKYVPPAIDRLAFNCPHCGALAKQFWFSTHAEPLKKDDTPTILGAKLVESLSSEEFQNKKEHAELVDWAKRYANGRPAVEAIRRTIDYDLHNVSLARCFNCDDISIWIYDRLIWPRRGEVPIANSDLPDDVRSDYEEAGAIIDQSPRGAAALLRLAVQKLCTHLGEKGKSIDDDIAALVKKGLDARVQQSLDVVRVVGNNAVHPGKIDLSDDRATAERLFDLVNIIAEIMISQPKHVGNMFNMLPESARKAIERRDNPKDGSG